MKKYEAATIEIVEIRNDVIRTSGITVSGSLNPPSSQTPEPYDPFA